MSSDRGLRLLVRGTGPVGRSIAGLHLAGGGGFVGVVSRSGRCGPGWAGIPCVGAHVESRECDVLLLAVPDDVLVRRGRELAAEVSGDVWVFHTSGVHDRSVFGDRPRSGSLHPLQSLPRDLLREPEALVSRARLAHWFHEGDGVEVARRLCATWGTALHTLEPDGKALYHAAAVMVSNHAVTLMAVADELLRAAGLEPAQVREPFAALLRGTAENLHDVGAPRALTGPVERGDVETLRRHLVALDHAASGEAADLYRRLARRTVQVAVEKGTLDAARADALRNLLESDS